MKTIKKELLRVKSYLLENFIEPFEDNSLVNFLSSGSKYIRSSLAILYLKSQNKEITDELIKILAVGEIIHNASLLHDDVIDEAELRREQKTLAKKYNSKVAILAGDFLISLAIEKLLTLQNYNILNNFKDCTKAMTFAEIKQLISRNKKCTFEEYVDICLGKTGKLFSTILESCAELACIDKNQAKSFGESFGIFFQIINDLDDKSAENDKENGIYTAIDILGIENTRNLLDNYKQKMLNLLEDFPENEYKEELEGLIINYGR